MSTSLNVVSNAKVFWESFNRVATRFLSLVIGTCKSKVKKTKTTHIASRRFSKSSIQTPNSTMYPSFPVLWRKLRFSWWRPWSRWRRRRSSRLLFWRWSFHFWWRRRFCYRFWLLFFFLWFRLLRLLLWIFNLSCSSTRFRNHCYFETRLHCITFFCNNLRKRRWCQCSNNLEKKLLSIWYILYLLNSSSSRTRNIDCNLFNKPLVTLTKLQEQREKKERNQ